MNASDISPAIREIHTRLGAGPEPDTGPGPNPGWRIWGPSWCILQAPASAMLQDGKQTMAMSPGWSWTGVRWPGSCCFWFQRGQRCEFTASSSFNTFRSERDFLLYRQYSSSPAAGELKRSEGQSTRHHSGHVTETRCGPLEVQVHQGKSWAVWHVFICAACWIKS